MTKDKINEVDDLKKEVESRKSELEKIKLQEKKLRKQNKENLEKSFNRLIQKLKTKDEITEVDIKEATNLKTQILMPGFVEGNTNISDLSELVGKAVSSALEDNEIMTLLNKMATDQGIDVKNIKLEEGKTPTSTIALLDKITYKLSAGEIPYNDLYPLKMEKGRSKKEITTFVTLDIDELGEVLPENISAKDINTLEAIITLTEANENQDKNIFTLNTIYRVEKKNLNANPNKRNLEQLKNRILKIMKTLITLDSSEEKEAYYPGLIYKETTYLLNAKLVEVEYKGNKAMAIQVLDTPILYRYAKAKKQLTNIPFELTDNQLIKTDSVLILENYLSKRISRMRNNKKQNRNILYETIYNNMNCTQKVNQQ